MKNILLLGASSDMAQAIAKKYITQGWSITLAGRSLEVMETLKKDLLIRSKETPVEIALFDATKFEQHSNFYHTLKNKPDTVVCVFGYMTEQKDAETNFKQTKQMIDTNFTGAISILNIIANDFEQRKNGTIIGISSVAGDRGRQSNYLYGCTKAGFSTYLAGLRNRLFPSNVHVITVKPGFCKTRMTAHLDLPPLITASPEQIARAIYQADKKRKNNVYIRWMWREIMCIIRHIPESIFKRLKM